MDNQEILVYILIIKISSNYKHIKQNSQVCIYGLCNHRHMCTHACMHIYDCVHMCVYTHVHIHTYVYIRMRVHVCSYVCVHM